MFEWFADPQAWAALLTLIVLEIVLGIDNIVFISILSGRLPEAQQKKARLMGLGLAMIGRVLLLLSITWLMGLTAVLFHLPFGNAEMSAVTGRDAILLLGGAFLIYKSTHEIHHRLEGEEEAHGGGSGASFTGVLIQILLLDLVFSLDSVITAVGMAEHVEVMIIAVVIAVLIMMVSMERISGFITSHPTIKMLALSFLLMIGLTLVAEGMGQHIPKGYIYTAMGFSLFVETLNLRSSKKRERERAPVQLRNRRIVRALPESET